MKVTTEDNFGILTVAVEGEINTITAPQVAACVEDLSSAWKLVFDLDQVRYVSSAGLRLFLTCQRTMSEKGGDMEIINCNDFLMEIMQSVGYDRIMKLERK